MTELELKKITEREFDGLSDYEDHIELLELELSKAIARIVELEQTLQTKHRHGNPYDPRTWRKDRK